MDLYLAARTTGAILSSPLGGTIDFLIANRNSGPTTMLAVVMGTLAILFAWLVLYPSGHAGFTGSPVLIGFEVVKTAALLLILGRVYLLNRKEDDQAARSKHVHVFGMAASLSVLIDVSMTIAGQYF
jgi:hypothetical protein